MEAIIFAGAQDKIKHVLAKIQKPILQQQINRQIKQEFVRRDTDL